MCLNNAEDFKGGIVVDNELLECCRLSQWASLSFAASKIAGRPLQLKSICSVRRTSHWRKCGAHINNILRNSSGRQWV